MFAVELPWLLPLAGVPLRGGPAGRAVRRRAGAVVAVAGACTASAMPAAGTARPARGVQAALPVFAVAMLLVPCAASVSTFLVLWELMALTSLLLVLAEHRRRPAVAEAGWWYAVMTQLGFVAILLGLLLYAAAAGGETFAALRAAAPVAGAGAVDGVRAGAGRVRVKGRAGAAARVAAAGASGGAAARCRR